MMAIDPQRYSNAWEYDEGDSHTDDFSLCAIDDGKYHHGRWTERTGPRDGRSLGEKSSLWVGSVLHAVMLAVAFAALA
jgi:hypothetical protein